ncbi:hypothetical protein HEP74_02780 [Xanthomonas sp. SS]|uniref:hypothetical protein n=1 Tax=Xanthomonas sp. SS TaxID=2724122 RepID=UPI00163A1D0C|nr:hypothetical protein [Xanthomonas sp. SS]QNH17625.1 hypothetical protein HEP74_02780 [Xanthomonas sp. SS]
MESTLWVPIIAGGFGLMTLHINKRNKVSEFRQAWIDAMREELSLFCGAARTLGSLLDQGQGTAASRKVIADWVRDVDTHNQNVEENGYSNLRVDAEERRKYLLTLTELEGAIVTKLDTYLDVCRKNHYKITLRLNLAAEGDNGTDPLHQQMDAQLQSILAGLGRGLQDEPFSYDQLLQNIDALLKTSSRMLKQEWERVKAGDLFHALRAKYRRLGLSSFDVMRDG